MRNNHQPFFEMLAWLSKPEPFPYLSLYCSTALSRPAISLTWPAIHLQMLSIQCDAFGDLTGRSLGPQDHVLSTYDRAISAYTRQEFERCSVSISFHDRRQAMCFENKLQALVSQYKYVICLEYCLCLGRDGPSYVTKGTAKSCDTFGASKRATPRILM